VSRSEFHFEFHTHASHVAEQLRDEARQKLQSMAKDRADMVGASVAIEELTQEETPHTYQARVVAYIRPENIAAVEKGETPEATLREALDAVETQIIKRRAKFHKPWERTDKVNDMGVYELNAREIYDTFAQQRDATKLIEAGRDNLAAQLMTDEKLDRQAAYHAADQMLVHAQELSQSTTETP